VTAVTVCYKTDVPFRISSVDSVTHGHKFDCKCTAQRKHVSIFTYNNL